MATLASHSDVMGNLFIGKYLCSVLGYGWKIMFGVSVLGGLAVFVVAMYERWRAEELQLKTYVAVILIVGLLTAPYFAWREQYVFAERYRESPTVRLTYKAEYPYVGQPYAKTYSINVGIIPTGRIKDACPILMSVSRWTGSQCGTSVSYLHPQLAWAEGDRSFECKTLEPQQAENPYYIVLLILSQDHKDISVFFRSEYAPLDAKLRDLSKGTYCLKIEIQSASDQELPLGIEKTVLLNWSGDAVSSTLELPKDESGKLIPLSIDSTKQ